MSAILADETLGWTGLEALAIDSRMNLKLRPLESPEEAHAFAGLLETGMRESASALGREAPRGIARRFLERAFDRPETLLLVAEGDGRELGIAATAPFEDPLSGETAPILIALYVDPSIRRRGVARALFAEAMRILAQRGGARLFARAAHNDDVLISMGERWGLVRAWELMSSE